MLRLLLPMLALLFAAAAPAQTLPKFTGFVVDAADVLPPEQEAALTRRLDDLQKSTGNQLVVATIPDLQGYPIEDYGIALLRGWQVGLKDTGNSAILIVAPNDRKVRIEVGYGLEPVLTDAFSSVVINGAIRPRFKAGDMPGGIVAGTERLAAQLALPDDEARAKIAEAAARFDRTRASAGTGTGTDTGIPIGLIVGGGLFILFVVLMASRGSRHGGRRYRGGGGGNLPVILWSIASEVARQSGRGGGGGWSGGGGGGSSGGGGWMGGGFTGGGGGSGGGGGASGSW